MTNVLMYTPLPDPRYPSRYDRFKVGYPYDETGDYFHLTSSEESVIISDRNLQREVIHLAAKERENRND